MHTNIHTDVVTRDCILICFLVFPALSTNPTHHHITNSFSFNFSRNSFCCSLNFWNIVTVWVNVISSQNNIILFYRILTSIKRALNRMAHLSGHTLNSMVSVCTAFPQQKNSSLKVQVVHKHWFFFHKHHDMQHKKKIFNHSNPTIEILYEVKSS